MSKPMIGLPLCRWQLTDRDIGWFHLVGEKYIQSVTGFGAFPLMIPAFADDLDMDTVLASIRKTRRAVIVDEGWRSGSLSAEIVARIMEQAFYDLDAPVARVCSAEVPIPYAKHLEDAALPQPEKIVAAVRALFGDGS